MIYGVGTDVVEISRIAASYERFGDHLPRRILLPSSRLSFFQHAVSEYVKHAVSAKRMSV